MLEIPLIAVPNQRLLVVLEEQDCTLKVYQRNERLYLDLYLDGVPLRQGAICLPRVDIPAHPYPFQGRLYFVDTLTEPDKQQFPQYTGLGSRWLLMYLTDEEYDEMLNEWREEKGYA